MDAQPAWSVVRSHGYANFAEVSVCNICPISEKRFGKKTGLTLPSTDLLYIVSETLHMMYIVKQAAFVEAGMWYSELSRS